MVRHPKGNGSTTANNTALSWLVVQAFAFLVFLSLLLVAILKIPRDDKMSGNLEEAGSRFMAVLLVSTMLAFVRTISRLTETAQGFFLWGDLCTYEGWFIGLEFVPIVLALGLLGAWHPGRWLTRFVGDTKGVL